MTVAGEDGQAGILGEARIAEGEVTEDEDGAVSRFDVAGMKAIGAQASTRRIASLLLRIRHEDKDNAARGLTIVRMNCRWGVYPPKCVFSRLVPPHGLPERDEGSHLLHPSLQTFSCSIAEDLLAPRVRVVLE
jgi:hypothetical protein